MMTTPKSTVGNHQGQEKFPVRQQLFPHRGNYGLPTGKQLLSYGETSITLWETSQKVY